MLSISVRRKMRSCRSASSRLFSPCDIAERDDRSNQLPVLSNQIGGVLDRKTRTIFSPENFIAHMTDAAVFDRGIDRAFFGRVGRSVRLGVVHQGVQRLAHQFFSFPTEHAGY